MAHIAAMAQMSAVFIGSDGHNRGPTVRCHTIPVDLQWSNGRGPKQIQGLIRGTLTAIGQSEIAKRPSADCHESKWQALAPTGVSPHYPIPNIAKSTPAAPRARLLLPSLRRSDVVICWPPVASPLLFTLGNKGKGERGNFYI
jgi:hypothetical protein